MVARTKRLLDTAAAPPHELTVTPRLPWDANRHSRLQMRSKPRSILERAPSWLDPLTEFTVDLRPVTDTEPSMPNPDATAEDAELLRTLPATSLRPNDTASSTVRDIPALVGSGGCQV